jgi:Pvc16 N-terminal domain
VVVLYDAGESVREMIRQRGGVPANIEILFDAPTKDWAARRSGPAIDVFLYDIRENLDRRQALLEDVRADDLVTGRKAPTRWFNCSYLITAWTQRPDDEHRLLGGILSGLVTVHAVPPECLKGALTDSEHDLFLTMCRPPGQERSISDIWSALGGELKPSLDLVVVVPIDPSALIPVGPPVLEAPSLFVSSERVREPAATAAKGKGAKRTDNTERKPGYRRAKAPASDPSDTITLTPIEHGVEELAGGTEAQPGRRFRFSVHEPPGSSK